MNYFQKFLFQAFLEICLINSIVSVQSIQLNGVGLVISYLNHFNVTKYLNASSLLTSLFIP